MRSSVVPSLMLLGLGFAGGCYDKPSVEDTDGGTGTAGTAPSTGAATSAQGTGSDGDSTSGSEETSAEETASSEGTTSEAACGAPDGMPDEACGAPTPLCWQGQCVGCGELADGDCAAANAEAPICELESGLCVGCVEHGQCESEACSMSNGACVADANRLFVDRGADCDTGDGTAENPLCAIATALDAVRAQPGDEPWAVFVAGSAQPYDEPFSWSSDHPLAVIGPSSGIAAEIQGGDGPVVAAAAGGQLSIARLVLQAGIDGSAIECFYAGAATSIWVDDVSASSGARGFVLDCDAAVRRSGFDGGGAPKIATGAFIFEDSVIDGPALQIEGEAILRRSLLRGTVDVIGGSARFENCIVTPQVGGAIPLAFLNVINGGMADIVYSTVVTEFVCDGGGPTSIRNSIVVPQTCPSTQIDNSAVDQGMNQGEGNAQLTPAMFPDVFEPGAGYHVLADAPVVTGLAVWSDGDPPTDFDGDPRPEVDGTPDYAGADVPTE